MEDAGVVANTVTCNVMVDGYMKQQELEKAEEVLQRMEQVGIQANIVTYTTLIDGYMKQQELEKVKKKPVLPAYNPDFFVGIFLKEDRFYETRR